MQNCGLGISTFLAVMILLEMILGMNGLKRAVTDLRNPMGIKSY